MEFQDAYWKNSKHRRQGIKKHFRTDQKMAGPRKQDSLMTMNKGSSLHGEQMDLSPRRSLLTHHEEISEITPRGVASINQEIHFHGPMQNKTLNQKSKRNSIVQNQAGGTFQFVRMAKNGPQIDARTPRDIDEYKIQHYTNPLKVNTLQMMKTHRIVSQKHSQDGEFQKIHKDLIISHRHQFSDDKNFEKRFREDMQRSKMGKNSTLQSGLTQQKSDQSSSIGSNEFPLIGNSKNLQNRRDIRDNQSSTVDFNGSVNSQMYTFREQLQVAQIAEKRFTQRQVMESLQKQKEGNHVLRGKQTQQMVKERNLMAKIIESSSKLIVNSPKKLQNTASKVSPPNLSFSPLKMKIQRDSFMQKLRKNELNSLTRKHTTSVDMDSPRSHFGVMSRDQLRNKGQQQESLSKYYQTGQDQQNTRGSKISHENYSFYDQNPMLKSKYEHIQSRLPVTNPQRQFNSSQNKLTLLNSAAQSPDAKQKSGIFHTDQKVFNRRSDSMSGQKYRDPNLSQQKQNQTSEKEKTGEFQIEEAFEDLRQFNNYKAEKEKITHNESAVQAIIKKAKMDHGSPDKGPSRKMIGKMPFNLSLGREHLIKIEEQNRKNAVQGELRNLAKNQLSMEGQIQVRDVAERLSRKRVDNQQTVKNYITNFSQVQDVLSNAKKGGSMNQFAKKIEGKIIQEKFKSDYKTALKQMILDARENSTKKAADNADSLRKELPKKITKRIETFEGMTEEQIKAPIFPQTKAEDQMQIQKVGHQFMQKIKYLDVFRHSVPENAKGVIGTVDPRIKYFKSCQKELNSVLPILDKIFRKTLCLQEYTLDAGHCQGLAAACEFFDNNVVNRVLFNNCGIDGDEFAKILEGLAKLQEVKSIVYKMNSINKNSIQNLIPIFRNRLPHHLEELKLIDCQIHSNLIQEMLVALQERSQLKTLAIVNAHQSEKSFAQLVSFVESSDYLEDLDISWSMLRPQIILTLLQVLRHNRQLKCLSLAFNQLFEENSDDSKKKAEHDHGIKIQPNDEEQEKTIEQDVEIQKEQFTFNVRDQEIMDCFTEFVKYNPSLLHLDLTSTGLTRKQLMFFGKLLTRSQSLRSIHLSANPCLYDKEVINWMQKRIRANHKEDKVVIPHYKPKDVPVVKKPAAGGGLAGKLFGGFGGGPKKDPQAELEKREQQKWKDLRAGIKLRNIVNSKRMNENSLQAGYEQSKLVIQRHLGFKNVIPKAVKWQMLTDVKDECFYCGQHLLTLFLWTPRIGQLSCLDTPGIEDYYRKRIEGNFADDDFMVDLAAEPKIAGQFTNWNYQQMSPVAKFAQANDIDPIDFKGQLIEDKIIRASMAGQEDGFLNQAEKDALQNRKQSYYAQYWPQVLMKMMRFKQPQIANSDYLSDIYRQKNLESNQVYCWVGFVKPGRHNYVIRHDNDEILSDGEEGKYDAKFSMFKQKTMIMGKKSTKDFYVHELLGGFRQEQLPEFAIERHIVRTEKKVVEAKKVFEEWEEDTAETENQCFRQDNKYMLYKELCHDDKQEVQRVENQIVSNYRILKKVYHYMQSKSKYYPRVDTYTIRKHFLEPMGITPGAGRLSQIEYDVVLARVSAMITHDEDSKKETEQTPKNHFIRCQFIEFTIRIAMRMFGMVPGEDFTDEDDYQNEFKLMKYPHKALQFFISHKLEKFCDDQNIQWQEFRDQQLWCGEMEEVYTLNEMAIKKLYARLANMHRGKNGKPENANWITYQDIEYFMKVDMEEFGFQKKDIRYVFGMSKMTVIDEFTGQKYDGLYQKLRYVEFLEVLARIAELFFEGSEMQDLELAKKIEHLLDEILPIVGAKRIKQRTIIEDFSESDDDY